MGLLGDLLEGMGFEIMAGRRYLGQNQKTGPMAIDFPGDKRAFLINGLQRSCVL